MEQNEAKFRPSAEKLTNWPNEPDVSTLKEDYEAAKPSHDTHANNVKRWEELRTISGKSKPKKIAGRSSVQPKVIRRQAEWRYSALSEPFLTSDKMFNASPVTFEDDFGAKQNELVLNWQFETKMNKVKFIDEYVRTAVDEGSVVVRVGWERNTRTVLTQVPVFEYSMASSQEYLQKLEAAAQLSEQNPREFSDLPEELQEAVAYLQETGTPAEVTIVGYEEVEEEEVVTNRPTAQVLHPENVFVDPSCEGDIDKANFVAVSWETSKAELIKDGRYKNLDAVNWSGNEILSAPDHATSTPTDFNFKDELRRKIVAYEYWGFYDIDGTDELKPIVATWVGDVMIRMEENPFPDGKLPFVIANYNPVKRKLFGEPDAELLEDNQAIIGAVTRGMIDLLGRSANAQQGYAKGWLDSINKRRHEKGLDYEFNPGQGDPRQAHFQHTYPEIPNSAMTMVSLQNQEAEALSGVKAFAGGLSAETYGDVAAGIKGMLDASSKREMNILRRLAKGIREIGVKFLTMNAVFLSEEETVRVTNKKFVKVKREDLKGQFDIRVDISTPEVDEAKAQDLGFMLQTLGPDLPPEIRNLILTEIAELKRMPRLAESIRTFEPAPDPVAEEIKRLEVEKLKAEIEKLKSEAAENMAQAGKYSSEKDLKDLEYLEEESGTKHERDLQKISEQSKGNVDHEIIKGLLQPKSPQTLSADLPAAIGYKKLTDSGF